MNDSPAFEVFNMETGQRFKVWEDGRTDGFGDARWIINRIPRIVGQAVATLEERIADLTSRDTEND